jgi:hypothetical protein
LSIAVHPVWFFDLAQDIDAAIAQDNRRHELAGDVRFS